MKNTPFLHASCIACISEGSIKVVLTVVYTQEDLFTPALDTCELQEVLLKTSTLPTGFFQLVTVVSQVVLGYFENDGKGRGFFRTTKN